jgi:hypothetical protein
MKDPEAAKAFEEYQEKERTLLHPKMFSKVPSEKDSLALIDLKMRLIRKYPLYVISLICSRNSSESWLPLT